MATKLDTAKAEVKRLGAVERAAKRTAEATKGAGRKAAWSDYEKAKRARLDLEKVVRKLARALAAEEEHGPPTAPSGQAVAVPPATRPEPAPPRKGASNGGVRILEISLGTSPMGHAEVHALVAVSSEAFARWLHAMRVEG